MLLFSMMVQVRWLQQYVTREDKLWRELQNQSPRYMMQPRQKLLLYIGDCNLFMTSDALK